MEDKGIRMQLIEIDEEGERLAKVYIYGEVLLQKSPVGAWRGVIGFL